MGNENFNHKESILLIESMIQASKQKLVDNGHIWLMWGIYVMIGAGGQLILQNTALQKYNWMGWMLWPIAVIITIISNNQRKKKAKIKTHTDEFMNSLWTAFGIAIAICIPFTMPLSHLAFLPFCMLLYGIGTFVSGAALKFTPLKYGGLICFLCAAISFNVEYNYQLMLIMATSLFGYIIPGIILNTQFKKEMKNA